MLTLTTLNADSTLAMLKNGERMIVQDHGWPIHLTALEMVALGHDTLHLESRAGHVTQTVDLVHLVKNMTRTPRITAMSEGL